MRGSGAMRPLRLRRVGFRGGLLGGSRSKMPPVAQKHWRELLRGLVLVAFGERAALPWCGGS